MNSDTEGMMGMITGNWVRQIVHAAATFSVADHLAKSGATAEEIARAEGTDPSASFRLLRSCASLGMVSYDAKSRFLATPLLDTLLNDNPKVNLLYWSSSTLGVEGCLSLSIWVVAFRLTPDRTESILKVGSTCGLMSA